MRSILIVSIVVACGGSKSVPHDPRFDQCVKTGVYAIQATSTSASGTRCYEGTQTYTSTLDNPSEGVYTLKGYRPTDADTCWMNIQVDPATCTGSTSGRLCQANFGITANGTWTLTSTGFSGTISTTWDFSPPNYCTQTETLTATLQ